MELKQKKTKTIFSRLSIFLRCVPAAGRDNTKNFHKFNPKKISPRERETTYAYFFFSDNSEILPSALEALNP